MKIIILTGSETRHEYFRKTLASDGRFQVLASYCEGAEQSLEARTKANPQASTRELQHAAARRQAEADFFGAATDALPDNAPAHSIPKGAINDDAIVEAIIDQAPDLLVCYGASLIKSRLLGVFEGRFVNVHLGLSPYYRGSGTNVWPLINREPALVGATFMQIDPGIDTGAIIHQIQADIVLGDSPHSIGNRLIAKMTRTTAELVTRYDTLSAMPQPTTEGRLYRQRDFDQQACERLYRNFRDGMIEAFLDGQPQPPALVRNPGMP